MGNPWGALQVGGAQRCCPVLPCHTGWSCSVQCPCWVLPTSLWLDLVHPTEGGLQSGWECTNP